MDKVKVSGSCLYVITIMKRIFFETIFSKNILFYFTYTPKRGKSYERRIKKEKPPLIMEATLTVMKNITS